MNPVAMEPIGGAGQGMGEGASADPGANMEAENSAEPAETAGFKYCIVPMGDTYSVYTETEADGSAEGEEASAAPVPAEGGESEGHEGEKSLGEGLSLVDAMKAILTAEKSRLSGGESDAQGNMDDGFQAQGGGAVHG